MPSTKVFTHVCTAMGPNSHGEKSGFLLCSQPPKSALAMAVRRHSCGAHHAAQGEGDLLIKTPWNHPR